jgi:hypothetical protein
MNQQQCSPNFNLLNIHIPDIHSHSIETQHNIFNYLNQLTPQQKKACIIAINHLETSFNIIKSNGYVKWYNAQNK